MATMQDQRKYRKGNTCRRLPSGDNHYKDDGHKQHSSNILTDGNANTGLAHSHTHIHVFTYHSTCGCICGTIYKADMYICDTKNPRIMSNALFVLYGSGDVNARCFCPGGITCLLNWRATTWIQFAFLLANRAQIKPGSRTWPKVLDSAIAG